MRLAEQWAEIVRALPEGWASARVSATFEDDEQARRAALVLGPLAPARAGRTFRLDVHSGVGPATPERLEHVLVRLERERVEGRLELVGTEGAPEEAPRRRPRRAPLAAAWDELLSRLPPDWSDIYAEVELDSTDFLDRGALLLAPVNPARFGGVKRLRFRSAKSFGYGVAAGMARRCFERLDREAITGTVRILRVLSDTQPSRTQGPVFRIGGRSV